VIPVAVLNLELVHLLHTAIIYFSVPKIIQYTKYKPRQRVNSLLANSIVSVHHVMTLFTVKAATSKTIL